MGWGLMGWGAQWGPMGCWGGGGLWDPWDVGLSGVEIHGIWGEEGPRGCGVGTHGMLWGWGAVGSMGCGAQWGGDPGDVGWGWGGSRDQRAVGLSGVQMGSEPMGSGGGGAQTHGLRGSMRWGPPGCGARWGGGGGGDPGAAGLRGAAAVEAQRLPSRGAGRQEKLTKSLAFILSSQDAVQSQIAELEETIRSTEVREGAAGGGGGRAGGGGGRPGGSGGRRGAAGGRRGSRGAAGDSGGAAGNGQG